MASSRSPHGWQPLRHHSAWWRQQQHRSGCPGHSGSRGSRGSSGSSAVVCTQCYIYKLSRVCILTLSLLAAHRSSSAPSCSRRLQLSASQARCSVISIGRSPVAAVGSTGQTLTTTQTDEHKPCILSPGCNPCQAS